MKQKKEIESIQGLKKELKEIEKSHGIKSSGPNIYGFPKPERNKYLSMVTMAQGQAIFSNSQQELFHIVQGKDETDLILKQIKTGVD